MQTATESEGACARCEGFGDKMFEGAGNGMPRGRGEGRKEITVRVIELIGNGSYLDLCLDFIKAEEYEV